MIIKDIYIIVHKKNEIGLRRAVYPHSWKYSARRANLELSTFCGGLYQASPPVRRLLRGAVPARAPQLCSLRRRDFRSAESPGRRLARLHGCGASDTRRVSFLAFRPRYAETRCGNTRRDDRPPSCPYRRTGVKCHAIDSASAIAAPIRFRVPAARWRAARARPPDRKMADKRRCSDARRIYNRLKTPRQPPVRSTRCGGARKW